MIRPFRDKLFVKVLYCTFTAGLKIDLEFHFNLG